MTCADFAIRMHGWMTGTLSAAEARDLEGHAAECPTCGARLESATRLAGLPLELAPPPALRSRTLAAIPRRRAARRWRLAVGLTGIAAIALFTVMMRPGARSARLPTGASRKVEAVEHARPAFATLADAERDVEAALQQHPGDRELSDALVRIRRQQEALTRLVREAGS